MKFSIILLLPLILLIVSCAKHVPMVDIGISSVEGAEQVSLNTPVLCDYRGKIGVKAANSEEKASFSGLLNKSCSGDIKLAILGTLNTVLARVELMEGGAIFITAQDKDIEDYLSLVAPSYMNIILAYLKSPIFLPDKNSKLFIEDGSYVFDDNGLLIYADSGFKIFGYKLKGLELKYSWDNNIITNISIKDKDNNISVKFLNKAGWKGLSDGL